MPLTATTKLPKASPSTTYTFDVSSVNAVENPGEKSWFSRRTATIDPPAFNVSGTISTSGGTSTVTASLPNGFANVRVGDAIGLAVGNSSGAALTATTVATKTNDNTITLTDDASNDGTGASVFSVNPAEITPTLYAIKEKHVYNGSSLTVEVWVYEYDGSLGSTAGSEANATRNRKLSEFTIDAGAFLERSRVVRGNADSVEL